MKHWKAFDSWWCWFTLLINCFIQKKLYHPYINVITATDVTSVNYKSPHGLVTIRIWTHSYASRFWFANERKIVAGSGANLRGWLMHMSKRWTDWIISSSFNMMIASQITGMMIIFCNIYFLTKWLASQRSVNQS